MTFRVHYKKICNVYKTIDALFTIPLYIKNSIFYFIFNIKSVHAQFKTQI